MKRKIKQYNFPSDTSVLKTLGAFDVPHRVSVPILRLVQSWMESMGPEAAVSRLKDLKLLYVNTVVSVPRDTWISRHSDGRPTGPFGWLWKVGSVRSNKVRTKILNVLQIYTGVVLRRTSENQWKKFKTSFVRKNNWTYPIFDKDIKNIEPWVLRGFYQTWRMSKYDSPETWCSSPVKRTKVFIPYEGMKCGIESDFEVEHHLMVGDQSNEGLAVHKYLDIYENTGYRPPAFYIRLKTEFRTRVGSLSVIQERGGKARFVANPYRIHQIALSKLGNALFGFLQSCSWDCTHDQAKGIAFCQEQLVLGKTAHCVDLSDATNNFPVEYQVEVLRRLCKDTEYQRTLDLFLFLSQKGLWVPPAEIRKNFYQAPLSCTQGQPLGLYPSFASFALVHGLIIHALERKFGVSDTFVVLGDDVAIFNQRVYNGYLSILKDLKVPVSRSKCIISDEIAEFAGKIITKSGPLAVEKWKGFKTSDPLSLLRWMGLKGLPLIPWKLRPLVRLYAGLPQPLGLGLNPEGTSASVRLDAVEDSYLLRTPRLRDDKAAVRTTRERDLHVAFGLDYEKTLRIQDLELCAVRQNSTLDEQDRIILEHLNSVIKLNGILPENLKAPYEELRRKKLNLRLTKRSKTTKSMIASIKRMFKYSVRKLYKAS